MYDHLIEVILAAPLLNHVPDFQREAASECMLCPCKEQAVTARDEDVLAIVEPSVTLQADHTL